MKLIKAIFCLFIILCFFRSNAQEFKSGAVLGITAAQFDGDNLGGFNRLGLMTGLFVKRNFKERWAWRFDLQYANRGSKKVYNDDNTNTGPFKKLNMHYIDVPLVLVYEQNEKLNFYVGPSFNYLIGFNFVEEPGWAAPLYELNDFELAGKIGLGYQIQDNLTFNFQAAYSMISIAKGTAFLPTFSETIARGQYNNWLSLNLQYNFN